MIEKYGECEYIKKHFKVSKVKKIKRRILFFIVILFLIISLITTYFIKIVNPIVLQYALAETEKMLVKSSNLAVQTVVDDYQYEDFFSIHYDKEGNISAITANQAKINEVANMLALKSQQNIDKIVNLSVQIPIGTCTGITFFTGKGNSIEVSLNPIGNISCEIKTEFLEAGINQTIHKMFLCVNGKVSLILPFSNKNINSSVQVLISECLIVGKIPNTYLGLSNIKDF